MRVARLGVVCLLLVPSIVTAQQQKSVPEQIADLMVQTNGGIHTGFRFNHAKGLVVTGTFTPTAAAKSVSRAEHFRSAAPVPVTVRFSDATGVPNIPDNNPNAAPRGMAIRFMLPKGAITDIMAVSHNGFIVGTGEEFLALFQAITSTKPDSPHPNPVEKFFGSHPRALKFAQDNGPLPAAFANLAYFQNNAIVLVDSAGTRRPARFQMIPVDGIKHLDSLAGSKVTPNYLFDELPKRLAKGPIQFKLYAQLANPGDQTKDGSMVWPDDRKKVEMGTLSLTTVAPDNEALQRKLMYNPLLLTDGIQLSDDPLPAVRSAVYAFSTAHRQ